MNAVLLTILIVYTVALAALLGTLIFKEKRVFFFPAKVSCSLLFLILGIYCEVTGGIWRADLLIIAGFVFCFVGDVILGLFNMRKNKKFFVSGTLFFLFGHIAFILATCMAVEPDVKELIIPILAELMLYVLLKKKNITMKKLIPVLYIYALFVSGFMARAISIFLFMGTRGALLLMIGSILFFISDTLIFFLYFVRDHRWSTHGWNLATYYVGMALIGLSIFF